MATITRGFECMSDRYEYDFRLCTYERGWAQIDTTQDASYYGTWCNPTTFELMNYCEGDLTHTQCDDVEDFKAEVRKCAEWNKERGYWLGIDPGFREQPMFARFVELGLDDLFHASMLAMEKHA